MPQTVNSFIAHHSLMQKQFFVLQSFRQNWLHKTERNTTSLQTLIHFVFSNPLTLIEKFKSVFFEKDKSEYPDISKLIALLPLLVNQDGTNTNPLENYILYREKTNSFFLGKISSQNRAFIFLIFCRKKIDRKKFNSVVGVFSFS